MTPVQIASAGGVLLALALSYFPGFGKWFNAQESATKVLITGVGLVLVSAGAFGLACAGINLGDVVLACTKEDALSLVASLIAALIANQSTYLLAVKPFARNNP